MAHEWQGKVALDIRDATPDWTPFLAPRPHRAHPTSCSSAGTTSATGPWSHEAEVRGWFLID